MAQDNGIDIYSGGFSDEFIHEWNRKRYCKRCGSPLQYDALGEYQCRNCGRKELDDYGKVRAYLDENGSSPARIIEDETGVPGIIIRELLEHGKIEVSGDESFLKCQICGRPIRSGRICTSCASGNINGLKGAFSRSHVGEEVIKKEERQSAKGKTKPKPKMYTRLNRGE